MSDHENQNSITENESYEGHIPDWTVMIYLAGDNNLSANSLAILQDLEAIADDENVRVLAGFDPSTPLPKGARYLEIHKSLRGGGGRRRRGDWDLHNDMVSPGHLVVSPDLCNPNPTAGVIAIDEPTAREGLSRFLAWSLKYPSKRRMLILFGHGTLVAGNTFLGDTTPPSFLRLADFKQIIGRYFGQDRQILDVLACDNCVMNGIEAAYEIRNYVNFMIGSQDLMLAVGWPFRKIIKVIQQHPDESTKRICRRILKACARSLIDFSLMERSSEQAVVDLRKLRDQKLRDAVRELAAALKEGLATDRCGQLLYPRVVDAVRLARLEAQSYWDETFVDLYDFCQLLALRGDRYVTRQMLLFNQFVLLQSLRGGERVEGERPPDKQLTDRDEAIDIKTWLLEATNDGKSFTRIVRACREIMKLFRIIKPTPAEPKPWERSMVPFAYYVCSQSQYSHGLSIYFPWVMPEAPIIFKPKATSGHYGYEITDFELKTAFDEYKAYEFARCEGTDWVGFLLQFFKATLRNVRLVEFDYLDKREDKMFAGLLQAEIIPERAAPAVDLQKTSSDTGEQDGRPTLTIKNYPRRFYLSPEDCLYREDRVDLPDPPCPGHEAYDRGRRVSYLGWNIRGITAECIGLNPYELDELEHSDAIE